MATTTIAIRKDLKRSLESLKLHPRETFNDVLERLLEDLSEQSEETKQEIEEAIRAYKAGRYKKHEELRKELGF